MQTHDPSRMQDGLLQKYAEERDKRTNKGLDQYVVLAKSEEFKILLPDPWVEPGTPINHVVHDDGHCKFLIVGAGFSGILFAVSLIKAGFSVDDLVIVDPAGGFGGAWYWNRYPGLMCDIESYIYLPMLEEMDYIPSAKYASGHEIRLYCESVCRKYGLHERAMFQSKCRDLEWNEQTKKWDIVITSSPKGAQETTIRIHSEFVFLGTGVITNPKMPRVPGIDTFCRQSMFHTARWDYTITGGSPEDPALEKLKNKRVAIVGTGASAVQVVPHLAKWSRELLVFQRTPSAVDQRKNHETDRTMWKHKVANKVGWQEERNWNYAAHVGNAEEKPDVDLVNDGWSKMPAYSAILGTPQHGEVTPESVGEHVARMHALDFQRSQMVRRRVQDIVEDEQTAKSLQAWYPGWCKRPCFHDEYLPTFNRPNVTLVDTNGKGIDQVTPNGIQSGDKEYEVDIIVWSTGYLGPGVGHAAFKGGIHLVGRDGKTLEQHWEKEGLSTLHGVTTRVFPNLFWPGPFQVGASPVWTFGMDLLTKHIAYVVSRAHELKKASLTSDSVDNPSKRVVIEPSEEAVQDWTMRCMDGVAGFAAVIGCTPSYFNNDGANDDLPMEEQQKLARSSPWPRGIVDFAQTLKRWQSDGTLDGFEVAVVEN
ncbi:FAD-binding monooxygenase ausC [Pseudocercospora fuligena]|uniref:L-ornithine N(5)-monooxygenase [NAD(P)H] n=1 Tax=Pseudocercospora fuligena TaxID=685502 RepID=A0A8H6R7J1_9PEZI|nr:FAD-binding monooxygenase ausC [Pseudocercospora fuligena]